jgi:hypothetical protein
MLNNYLDEYNKIIEILEPLNKDQCCKITKDLLIKINEEIRRLEASEIFNHLTNFIAKAILKVKISVAELLTETPLEKKTVDFVTLYIKNNYNSVEEAVSEEDVEAELAVAVPEVEEAEEEADEVPKAAAAATFDDVKKKCVALGSTKNRFVKSDLSSKIIELVTKKYPIIDREKLKLVLETKETSHHLLCSILQLPADSEASLNDATINEEILNTIFELPKLGGNIDYNKECQIM